MADLFVNGIAWTFQGKRLCFLQRVHRELNRLAIFVRLTVGFSSNTGPCDCAEATWGYVARMRSGRRIRDIFVTSLSLKGRGFEGSGGSYRSR
jgi:hypothetical protein